MTSTTDKLILLIEDHVDIAEMLEAYLSSRGFSVDYAADGVTGLHLAVSNDYSAIILDLSLPGMDGLKVCENLREQAQKKTPVIMLTARDTIEDKITGFNIGADDYLVKPFAVKELEARLMSLIRRDQDDITSELLRVADLNVDTSTMTVIRNGESLKLTPIGFKILILLMRASPAVVTRDDLERKLWGDILPDSDTLRSHLYMLRKTVDKPFDKPLIQTIQGRGFKIVDDPNEH